MSRGEHMAEARGNHGRVAPALFLFLLIPLVVLGCAGEPGGCDCASGPCDAAGACQPGPPESVCAAAIEANRLEDGCGVVASASLGDDTNPGTLVRPVATIAHAIELARKGRGRVYLCAESFRRVDLARRAEPVTLPSGIDLWGGFDCDTNWRYIGDYYKTSISTDRGLVPLTVVPDTDEGDVVHDGISTISGVNLSSSTGLSSGASSFAMIVRPGAVVELLRSELDAARGTNGGDGESAPREVAADGLTGNRGLAGCSSVTTAGAPEVVTECGGTRSVGGRGGDGHVDRGGDGAGGEPLSTPNADGLGGTGQQDERYCESGMDGKNGAPGRDGAHGVGMGRITDAGYEGVRGSDGTDGAPGQGGGGGGGSRGGARVCGDALKGGASGGSGGSGGCGGKGSKGGGYGGASIGVLVLHAQLTVRQTLLQTYGGGDGGWGGEAQRGGRNSQRGFGVEVPNRSSSSCSGGMGGFGGYGGFGGGGTGGPSIGIAYLGDEQQITVLEDVTFRLGPPGRGGRTRSLEGSRPGEAGFVAETFRFPE